MSTRIKAALAVLLLGSALPGCGRQPARAETDDGFDLEIHFDGGYVYRIGGQDAIEVVSLGGSNAHTHPMKVQVHAGEIDGPRRFDVTDARLEFWPGGRPPAALKPRLRLPDTSQVECPDDDPNDPDNHFFIQDLDEVARGMETALLKKPPRAASLLLTGGGRLRVASLGGCVAYRYPDNRPYGQRRSMASGENGIHYDWRIQGTQSLTLRLTPRDGEATPYVVTPERGLIRLEIGSFEKHEGLATGGSIPAFESFYAAFEPFKPEKKLSLWWIHSYGPSYQPSDLRPRSPGIDCPSGSDPGEPLPWP